MSARSEARLKRSVKKKRRKVLRDIATEFNIGNGDHSVSERTVQRYLNSSWNGLIQVLNILTVKLCQMSRMVSNNWPELVIPPARYCRVLLILHT
jgi:hypothetical protein